MIFLNTSIKALEPLESGELKIQGKASTPSTDRARDIILADAWAKGGIDNYRKNPILLFNHDYNEPIGKVTGLSLNGEGLEVEGIIYEGSKAYPLVKNGVLKTFSVGFLIKDADYNKANDGLIIKDAELLEISVVSVPCNQDATFELSKFFKKGEFEELKQKFGKEQPGESGEEAPASSNEEMTKEEIEKMLAESTTKAVEAAVKAMEEQRAKEDAEAKALAEKEAAEKAAKEEQEKTHATAIDKAVAEKLEAAVQKALTEGASNEELKTLSEAVKSQEAEIKSLRESRGFFPDREKTTGEWKKDKDLRNEVIEGFILSKALKKPMEEIEHTKSLMEKVNTQSSIQMSSDTYEQEVTNEIIRDIQQQLVIAPLFREVQLRSATQLLPFMSDTGYATHQTTGSTLPGTKPNGLLNNEDGSQPRVLEEITFRTDKLVSKAYLANDTEEDVLIPLLPLIRDDMVRQHAKSVDQMILTAGVAGGIYPNMVSKGLAAYAATGGRTVEGPSVAGNGSVTGRNLLAARSNMGKYGLNPQDIVYVVSTNAYFELLKDEDFYNNDEVGTGTKVTGEVGRMFGSRILVSSELSETVAAGEIAAYALNTRNFVIPRLRGMTSESEYSVEGQHWVLASTQRLGFTEVVPGAKSVTALAYAA